MPEPLEKLHAQGDGQLVELQLFGKRGAVDARTTLKPPHHPRLLDRS